jgi:hypothetical protein
MAEWKGCGLGCGPLIPCAGCALRAIRERDRYQAALEAASQRWCWCKQEDLPRPCAKCIAEAALIAERIHHEVGAWNGD